MTNSHVRLIEGNMLERLADLEPNSFDSCVTDAPYELGFMGRSWDSTGIAFQPQTWAAVLRVLKPGAHLLAFGGSRGFHRMAVAIEDAGFEIRDTIMWVYGSGFPKSHNVSKAIDKHLGAEREIIGQAQGAGSSDTESMGAFAPTYDLTIPATPEAMKWSGWGTTLKPAYEPIIVARKPLIGTVAVNVLEHGTGALNIDACRIEGGPSRSSTGGMAHKASPVFWSFAQTEVTAMVTETGRWPANLIHDGSDEVLECFPDCRSSGKYDKKANFGGSPFGSKGYGQEGVVTASYDDHGSAARFFYSAKACKADREPGNDHPTVKPTSLMRYLCRLVTPVGGMILDPFMGSGSTGKGAVLEGFDFTGIELDPHYLEIAERRIRSAHMSESV